MLDPSLNTAASQLDLPELATIDAASAMTQANALNPVQWGRRCYDLWRKIEADQQCVFLDEGGLRRTYRQGQNNSVFKVPNVEHWMLDANDSDHEFLTDVLLGNLLEYAHWMHQDFFGAPVLPCRMVWTDQAVPVLVMEFVDTKVLREHKPAWGLTIDGGQVAWSNMLDRWAAFDACLRPTPAGASARAKQTSLASRHAVFSLMPEAQVPALSVVRGLS